MGKFTRWCLGLFLLFIGLILLVDDKASTGLALFILGLAYWCLPFQKGNKKAPAVNVSTQVISPQPSRPTINITYTMSDKTYDSSNKITKNNARWIPPGEPCIVAGKTISGGYIYVGTSMPASVGPHPPWAAEFKHDPALINLDLPVAENNPDTTGQHMGYWPSYSEIDPSSRLAYIEWLAEGKDNPQACIGYVFLYFYGIERRIIADLPPDEEILRLIAEIKRLRNIYLSNNSFDRYSRRLLEAAQIILTSRNIKDLPLVKPTIETTTDEQKALLLMALSYQMQKGDPLTFDWAMVGYFFATGRGDRATVRKAKKQFLILMQKRFEKKWPTGFKLKKKQAPFYFYYSGANQYLRFYLEKYLSLPAMPSAMMADWSKLIELGNQVEEDISAYARAVGREPEKADSLEALLLLPPELANEKIRETSEQLNPWLLKVATPLGSVTIETLMEIIIKDRTENCDQKKLRSLAVILEKFGYGFEPDPDFTSARVKLGDKIVLFDARSLKGIRSAPSNSYKLAMPIAILLSGVGASSASGMGEEEIRWIEWIQKTFHLSEMESRRLRAYLEWLNLQKLTAARIKKAISEIPADHRNTIAYFAASVAYADGVLEKDEIVFLEKIYDDLGIERKQLYATLHDMGTERSIPASAPITVENTTSSVKSFIIQQPPAEFQAKKKVKKGLDRTKIDKILEDTKQVSTILGDILKEDEPLSAPKPANTNVVTTDGQFAGLDASHAALATHLIERREWDRKEFEKLAQGLNLMPNGALEVINEWAFDKFDEPLIEDGDRVEVNLALIG